MQHNMEDVEKLALLSNSREALDTVIKNLLQHTRTLGASHPDLVIWPETSYPMTFPARSDALPLGRFTEGYAEELRSTVRSAGVPLLFGGYESTGRQDYNSAILLGANGVPLASYRKVVLLMFGEYIPFTDWFPWIKDLNPQMGDFARGEGPIPIPFSWRGRDILIGANICYEAILPEFMRQMVKNGAELFLNVTKDSWFGDTFEPWQHMQLSIIRSIEHRIPMVRITNTGLSGVISAIGETDLLSNPFQRAIDVRSVKVPKQGSPTLYTLFGEWFARACLLFSLLAIFYIRQKNRRLS